MLAALCVLAVGSLFTAAVAGAKTITPYEYSGNSFGAGSLTGASDIAVDAASDAVYVLNSGTLYKFDSAGAPAPFSDPDLSGATSITFPTVPSVLAVDNSGTASQGNIYALKTGFTEGALYGLDSTGKALSGNWPICNVSCGPGTWDSGQSVSVGLDGMIWVGDRHAASSSVQLLNGFDVTGASTGVKFRPEGEVPTSVCGQNCNTPEAFRVAFDSKGDVYFATDQNFGSSPDLNQVMKFDSNGKRIDGHVDPKRAAYIDVDRSNDNLFVDDGTKVTLYAPSREQIGEFGTADGPYTGLADSTGIAVNPNTHAAYVGNGAAPQRVDIFTPGPAVTVPDVSTGAVSPVAATAATLRGTVDPDNGGDATVCEFEWGTSRAYGNTAACLPPPPLGSGGGEQAVSAPIAGLSKGTRYFYRLVAANSNGVVQSGVNRTFRAAELPVLSEVAVTNVNTNTAQVKATIDPQGGDTRYRVELGTTPGYGTSVPVPDGKFVYGFGVKPLAVESILVNLGGLIPGTTYHYSVVAENDAGRVESADRTFNTYEFIPVIHDPCANVLARQQSGAALLLDCRAYELVSAGYAGGFAVESDLIPGQSPFGGYPLARDRALYGVHAGVVPESGNPTNLGIDPYIATRGTDSWSTRYVGIPANGTPSPEPFASTFAGADAALSAFAFAGPEICDPCFGDGSAGIPVRLPSGDLVQGMAGSLSVADPTPAGEIAKPLSADGSHFVFGSEQKFESDGNSGEVSIYVRDLVTGKTQVASKTPTGLTMSGDVAQLDISSDGSRVLIGELVSTDPEGNDYYRLYMNVDGAGNTVALTPGSTSGALYAGMSDDGTEVYFATPDPLQDDSDTSADIYRAQVSGEAATLARVSTGDGAGDQDSCNPAASWNSASGGPDCDAVAIAGGGGVADGEGSIHFLSPEKLDGPTSDAIDGEPNLYRAVPGAGTPQFIVTLETTNPLVEHAISAADTRNTADFQVNPSGEVAVFTTTLPLKPGFESRGFPEVYRHDAGEEGTICVSCTPSNAPADGGGSLATNGLSVTDDGRVFFNSLDPLVLRDSNNKQDAYEWDDGVVELISGGIDDNDSSLLSVTADGTDAFFFTHATLVSDDENGPLVKLYDARKDGGFFVVPPNPPCAASDECHGPGTQAAAPPAIRTVAGTYGQFRKEGRKHRRCRRGFVKRKGRCVRRKRAHRKRDARRHKRKNKRNSTRRAGSGRTR